MFFCPVLIPPHEATFPCFSRNPTSPKTPQKEGTGISMLHHKRKSTDYQCSFTRIWSINPLSYHLPSQRNSNKAPPPDQSPWMRIIDSQTWGHHEAEPSFLSFGLPDLPERWAWGKALWALLLQRTQGAEIQRLNQGRKGCPRESLLPRWRRKLRLYPGDCNPRGHVNCSPEHLWWENGRQVYPLDPISLKSKVCLTGSKSSTILGCALVSMST